MSVLLFVPQGEIELALYKLGQQFDVEMQDGEKWGLIHDRIVDACSAIHSKDDLKALSIKFIEEYIEEYKYNGLRVFLDVRRNKMLEFKYSKLLAEMEAYIDWWLVRHQIKLDADRYLFGVYILESFKEIYGYRFDGMDRWTIQLYGILRTIAYNHYNEVMIDTFFDEVKMLVAVCGNQYFLNKDLKDVDVLKDLFNQVGEAVGDEDAFKGHQLFYEYDGYGGSYCDI